MRECRGHLAHRGQPRYVDELGLQLLKARLRSLPLGQVANETGEIAPIARSHLADRQLYGKCRTILSLADDDAADSDNAALSGAAVLGEIAVVLLAIRSGHQN